VAWTAHLTSRGVRSRPSTTSRSSSASIWSVRLENPPDQVLGHPGQLPVAVAVRRRPLHPQCPDEFALVGGPVDGVRSQAVAVQVAAVQGCPASVRSLGAIGDDQVGVHQRIAFSGRPMVKPDRQHSLSGHMLDTAVSAAGSHMLIQIGDRLGQPSVMRL
jgi:hypothetical protein